MATTKTKGDLAELMVAADLRKKGYKVAIPFGEDWDYDLVIERDGQLERVQVKHVRSDGAVVEVPCRSHSLTNGKVKRTKFYSALTIDWLAVYDAATEQCFYVPAHELGNGRTSLSLRIAPTRNHQARGIRLASDYLELSLPRGEAALPMEPAGLEPQ
jgi:PD-(D/E)XK nuclease superfamily protein